MTVYETKERKITLLKEGILYDIDALTFKLTEATMQGVDPKSKSAVASDRGDDLDSSILNRLADYRDATIRQRLQFCLKAVEITEYTNKPSEETDYVYDLVLPVAFKDASLQMVGTKIHEYIVKGALLDWYTQMGVATNLNALTNQVAEIEGSIVNMLRVPSCSKKPLQPFGPRL